MGLGLRGRLGIILVLLLLMARGALSQICDREAVASGLLGMVLVI